MATHAVPDADGAAVRPGRGEAQVETRPAAVVVSGLTKSYGDIEAVRGIDFEVAAGEASASWDPTGPGSPPPSRCVHVARPTAGWAS